LAIAVLATTGADADATGVWTAEVTGPGAPEEDGLQEQATTATAARTTCFMTGDCSARSCTRGTGAAKEDPSNVLTP
jgi:hypothetical protein